MKGDDFKRYVNSLRGKSTTYKKKRGELSDLRAEFGVLSRTVEILRGRGQVILQTLANLESEKGITGFRDTQDNLERVAATKADLDSQKGKTLEDMSGLVNQLTMKISERKARLAPIIKELRPLRQQSQDLQVEKRVFRRFIIIYDNKLSIHAILSQNVPVAWLKAQVYSCSANL